MSLLLWKAVLCYSHVKVLIPQKPGAVPGADMQSGTCYSLFQPSWCSCSCRACAGKPEQPRSDTASAKLRSPGASHLCSLHLLSLWPPPPPHCTSGEQNHPRSCPRFIPRHMVEKQGSAAKREDDGTAGKVEGQASETSLPPAAQGIRHLLIFYRKPGNIHMEISHFQSIRGVAQGFSQLCFTSCRSYCFPLFHCTMRET